MSVTYVSIMHPDTYRDLEIVRWVLAHDFIRFWLGERLFLFMPEKKFRSDYCKKIVSLFHINFCEVKRHV